MVPVAPSLFLGEFLGFHSFDRDFLEAVFLLQRLRNSCLVVGSTLANKFDLDLKDRALRLQLFYVRVSHCHLPKFRLQES
jgi:hypothetical protein